MIVRRPLFKVERGLYLGVAAAFWFFLAASAPHRVHHFFEQFPAPGKQQTAHDHIHQYADGEHHRHDGHDRQRGQRPSQQNDCVVLAVVQNAQASIVESFSFAVLESAVARGIERPAAIPSSFNPSPFSQRAPPLV
jgi:cytidylate kinase